jgi:hypothetical protein
VEVIGQKLTVVGNGVLVILLELLVVTPSVFSYLHRNVIAVTKVTNTTAFPAVPPRSLALKAVPATTKP